MFSLSLLGASAFCLTLLQGFSNASPVPDIAARSIGVNPVIYANFPDPSLIHVDGTWYSFATRTIGSTIHIQIASSPDFETWTIVQNSDGSQKDAMPVLPPWVDQTNWQTWAPDVVRVGKDSYVMYFSALLNNAGHHCTGYATATNILGPYTGTGGAFICPLTEGGAIDASHFHDKDGSRYIVYKVDGDSIGHGGTCGNTVAPIVPTPLILQQVGSDGVTFEGDPITLLNNLGAADQGVIEAPVISRSPSGTYFLFFSSGCFTGSGYTVSYATATNVKGPYTRQSTPLLQTGTDGLVGPGGASVVGSKMVFHAYQGAVSAFQRDLHTATLTYNGDSVSI